MTTPTAILVVVGNEVLSAKVQDENGPWAARRLRELGVRRAYYGPGQDAIVMELRLGER